jgi:hypothetical protein
MGGQTVPDDEQLTRNVAQQMFQRASTAMSSELHNNPLMLAQGNIADLLTEYEILISMAAPKRTAMPSA